MHVICTDFSSRLRRRILLYKLSCQGLSRKAGLYVRQVCICTDALEAQGRIRMYLGMYICMDGLDGLCNPTNPPRMTYPREQQQQRFNPSRCPADMGTHSASDAARRGHVE